MRAVRARSPGPLLVVPAANANAHDEPSYAEHHLIKPAGIADELAFWKGGVRH